jgi:hypothetical protein
MVRYIKVILSCKKVKQMKLGFHIFAKWEYTIDEVIDKGNRLNRVSYFCCTVYEAKVCFVMRNLNLRDNMNSYGGIDRFTILYESIRSAFIAK